MSPEIDWVYVGFLDGTFIGYHGGNRSAVELTSTNFDTDTLDFIQVDQTRGLPSSSSPVISHSVAGYDPRLRPWFNTTNLQGTWSDPYQFAQEGSPLGITFSKPLLGPKGTAKEGQVHGVIAADYLFTGLHEFLSSAFDDPEASTAFIFEEATHYLIASNVRSVSISENSFRIRAEESQNEIISTTVEWLMKKDLIPERSDKEGGQEAAASFRGSRLPRLVKVGGVGRGERGGRGGGRSTLKRVGKT